MALPVRGGRELFERTVREGFEPQTRTIRGGRRRADVVPVRARQKVATLEPAEIGVDRREIERLTDLVERRDRVSVRARGGILEVRLSAGAELPGSATPTSTSTTTRRVSRATRLRGARRRLAAAPTTPASSHARDGPHELRRRQRFATPARFNGAERYHATARRVIVAQGRSSAGTARLFPHGRGSHRVHSEQEEPTRRAHFVRRARDLRTTGGHDITDLLGGECARERRLDTAQAAEYPLVVRCQKPAIALTVGVRARSRARRPRASACAPIGSATYRSRAARAIGRCFSPRPPQRRRSRAAPRFSTTSSRPTSELSCAQRRTAHEAGAVSLDRARRSRTEPS